MDNNKSTAFQFTMGTFTWFTGVVEDRMDPKKLGRLRVRLLGFHTDNKDDIPTDELFWMTPMMPANSSSMGGIGSSPTGIVEGTWVVGFFRDGEYLQDGIIMGTIGGIPSEKPNAEKGFFDPNEKYPKEDFIGEADTNRLSRNEKIAETIVQDKKDNQDTDVTGAFGWSFSEPDVPDSREYPYNHVKETESGHVEEYDDTEGAERFHRYHTAGTFVEVHEDGTEVRHVVKDKFELIVGDDSVHIKGDCNVTVEGDANILVEKDCNLEVKGDYNQHVYGDYTLLVNGVYQVQSDTYVFMNSPRGRRSFDINSNGAPRISF